MVTWVRLEEDDRDPKYLAADGRHSSAEFNIRNQRKRSHEFEREKAGWRTYIGGVGGRKGIVGSDIIINSEDKKYFKTRKSTELYLRATTANRKTVI